MYCVSILYKSSHRADEIVSRNSPSGTSMMLYRVAFTFQKPPGGPTPRWALFSPKTPRWATGATGGLPPAGCTTASESVL